MPPKKKPFNPGASKNLEKSLSEHQRKTLVCQALVEDAVKTNSNLEAQIELQKQRQCSLEAEFAERKRTLEERASSLEAEMKSTDLEVKRKTKALKRKRDRIKGRGGWGYSGRI